MGVKSRTRKKTKKPVNIINYLQQHRIHTLLILLAVIFLFFFGNITIRILFFPIGIFLGYWSTLSSKFVPHITLETMTIMSIVAGMLFGWQFAFVFGVITSLIVYALLSIIKLTTIVNSFVIATGGIFSYIFFTILHIEPRKAMMFALICRTLVAVVAFWNISPDKLEALSHAIIDPVFNIGIYMQLFFPLYLVLVTVI